MSHSIALKYIILQELTCHIALMLQAISPVELQKGAWLGNDKVSRIIPCSIPFENTRARNICNVNFN